MQPLINPVYSLPSIEIVKRHLLRYHHSLIPFIDRYNPIFFPHDLSGKVHYPYICPLCVSNGFAILEEDKTVATASFTKDHFPPESAGGNNTILVCERCNSEAGSDYDYVLKDYLEHKSFEYKHPGSSLPMKAAISSIKGNYNGTLEMDENGKGIIDFYRNRNTVFLNEWIEQSKESRDFKIEMTVYRPEDDKIAKALLKTAYLYAFAFWGYSFVYSENGELIRRVLRGEIEYPVKAVSSFHFENSSIPFPPGLCFIQKPVEWQGYAVNIPLTLKETGFHAVHIVLIPLPHENGWAKLEAVAKLLESKPEAELSMIPVHHGMKENNKSSSDGNSK